MSISDLQPWPQSSTAWRWLNRLYRSRFVRSVATLSSGQTVAATLPILAAPILGRLYFPSDYGILAAYMAFANVLGTLSTLQLQHGIIAEASEGRAFALIGVCTSSALGIAFLSALIGGMLAVFVALPETINAWFLFLPITTVLSGYVAGATAFANRRAAYASIVTIQIASTALTVGASIVFGFAGWRASGLLSSYFLGQAITLIGYMWLMGSLVPRPRQTSLTRKLHLAYSHRRFAVYTLPGQLLSAVSLQLPVFALTSFGAATLLGYYNRANALIRMPVRMVSSAIARVFRQRAAEDFRAKGNCKAIYQKTFLALLAVGLPSTILLMIFAPDLLEFVLGPHWREAGELARIMAPMLLLRLLSAPLSSVFLFSGAQKQSFVIMASSAALTALLVFLPLIVGLQPEYAIYGFISSYSITYAIYLIASYRIATGSEPPKL